MKRALLLLLLALPLGCRGTFDISKYIADGESGDGTSAESMDAASDGSETRFEETTTDTGTDTDPDTTSTSNTDTSTDTNTDTSTDTSTDTDGMCQDGFVDIGGTCFGVRQILEIGAAPTDLEVAEFSDDDFPDLLVSGNPVMFYTGGPGGFIDPSTVMSANGPQLASVDWDQDGKRDFVAINPQQFQVFLAGGGGVFIPSTSTQPGGSDVVFADFFDNDVDDDAFVSASMNLTGFQRNSNMLLPDTMTSGVGTSLAVGDIDGDNTLDVVMAMPATGQIGVYLNDNNAYDMAMTAAMPSVADVAAAEIDGQFGEEFIAVGGVAGQVFLGKVQDLSISQLGLFAVGGLPRAVAVGDIDGDGLTDVAVANASTHDISVLLNNGGDLTNEIRFWVDSPNDNPESIVVANIDGDSRAEIIVGMLSSNRVLVYGAAP